jgi:hypothetical protein
MTIPAEEEDANEGSEKRYFFPSSTAIHGEFVKKTGGIGMACPEGDVSLPGKESFSFARVFPTAFLSSRSSISSPSIVRSPLHPDDEDQEVPRPLQCNVRETWFLYL